MKQLIIAFALLLMGSAQAQTVQDKVNTLENEKVIAEAISDDDLGKRIATFSNLRFDADAKVVQVRWSIWRVDDNGEPLQVGALQNPYYFYQTALTSKYVDATGSPLRAQGENESNTDYQAFLTANNAKNEYQFMVDLINAGQDLFPLMRAQLLEADSQGRIQPN